MRTIHEIESDIKNINGQIITLKSKLYEYKVELKDRMFANFCFEHNIKPGDVVEVECVEKFQIIDMNTTFPMFVDCRKIKRNGEPYANITGRSKNFFDGCKVVGHIELR